MGSFPWTHHLFLFFSIPKLHLFFHSFFALAKTLCLQFPHSFFIYAWYHGGLHSHSLLKFFCVAGLLTAGDWKQVISKVPSNTKRSMILWFSKLNKLKIHCSQRALKTQTSAKTEKASWINKSQTNILLDQEFSSWNIFPQTQCQNF